MFPNMDDNDTMRMSIPVVEQESIAESGKPMVQVEKRVLKKTGSWRVTAPLKRLLTRKTKTDTAEKLTLLSGRKSRDRPGWWKFVSLVALVIAVMILSGGLFLFLLIAGLISPVTITLQSIERCSVTSSDFSLQMEVSCRNPNLEVLTFTGISVEVSLNSQVGDSSSSSASSSSDQTVSLTFNQTTLSTNIEAPSGLTQGIIFPLKIPINSKDFDALQKLSLTTEYTIHVSGWVSYAFMWGLWEDSQSIYASQEFNQVLSCWSTATRM
jgi:hypothetical protein